MSHEPLFFLHFPRTAGTTVDDIFFNNFSPDQIIKIYSREEYVKYREIDDKSFMNVQYITGHLILPNLDPPQFYGKNVRAFTFLRDPVKRLHSEYIFLKTWKNQHLYDYLNSNKISFSQYITSDEQLLRYRGKNFMTRCLSGKSLENSNPDEALQKAKYNLENNFIAFGIQDRFLESMLLLSKKTGLKNILHQRRNSLKYNGTGDELTEDEIEIAKEYNKLDIELYAFACELFDRRIQNEGAKFQIELKNYTFLNSKYQHLANMIYESATKTQDDKLNMSKDIIW